MVSTSTVVGLDESEGREGVAQKVGPGVGEGVEGGLSPGVTRLNKSCPIEHVRHRSPVVLDIEQVRVSQGRHGGDLEDNHHQGPFEG